MFSASVTEPDSEIDITEFGTENGANVDEESGSETSLTPEKESSRVDYEFENLQIDSLDIQVEPSKTASIDFDDVLLQLSDFTTKTPDVNALFLVICSPKEFMTKNTLQGKHLDMLSAGTDKQKMLLICNETDEPPVNFLPNLLQQFSFSDNAKVFCYFGNNPTSKIFALRLDSGSIKCTFPEPVSHFHSSFFHYF